MSLPAKTDGYSCYNACVSFVGDTGFGCDLTDPICLCRSQVYNTAIGRCLVDKCPSQEAIDVAVKAGIDSCASHGVSITVTTPTKTSTAAASPTGSGGDSGSGGNGGSSGNGSGNGSKGGGDDKSGPRTAVIVGAAVGGVVGLALILGLIILLCRRRPSDKAPQSRDVYQAVVQPSLFHPRPPPPPMALISPPVAPQPSPAPVTHSYVAYSQPRDLPTSTPSPPPAFPLPASAYTPIVLSPPQTVLSPPTTRDTTPSSFERDLPQQMHPDDLNRLADIVAQRILDQKRASKALDAGGGSSVRNNAPPPIYSLEDNRGT